MASRRLTMEWQKLQKAIPACTIFYNQYQKRLTQFRSEHHELASSLATSTAITTSTTSSTTTHIIPTDIPIQGHETCDNPSVELLQSFTIQNLPLSLHLPQRIAATFPEQEFILFPINDVHNSTFLNHWTIFLSAPSETPYSSFRFQLSVNIPHDYPHSPPQIAFVTPIFHPNISFETGEICLDILKAQWSPTWTLEACCRAILLLLQHPEPDSPLNIDAANIFRSGDQRGYFSLTRMYTLQYGIPLPTVLQQQQ